MKIKTSELVGVALNYAVAASLGAADLQHDGVATWWVKLNGKDRALSRGWSQSQTFTPSIDWLEGGPIIEQERMLIKCAGSCWVSYDYGQGIFGQGPTPLVAAMRCFVASKLGDEVDVPEELLS